MNYYTMLWSQNTCNKAIGLTGEISTNISCNQFIKRGVREGDRIYSVGTRNGSVILIAALTVGEILLSRQAFRRRAGFEPWSTDEHILAQPGSGTPIDFENILPVKVVQALQSDA